MKTLHDISIHIENLKFSWDGKTPTLDLPLLSIRKGEKIFIKGPSGCGKSTLLNLIGGVLSPQEGQLSILQQDYTRMNQSQRDHLRGSSMGFIFQMFNLLPYLSILENITLPCETSALKKEKALKQSSSVKQEAKRLLNHLKLNKLSPYQQKATSLSVGQQQRVATARALIGSPQLIIADEPTSALDTSSREAFIKLLLEECEKNHATLIFVSHDPFLSSFFDRTIDLPKINNANRIGSED